MFSRFTIRSLIALLCGGILAPLVPAQLKAEMPACCRRGGRHHCAKNASPESKAGNVLVASAVPCPLYPAVLVSFGGRQYPGLVTAKQFDIPEVIYRIFHAAHVSNPATSPSATRPQRGPPTFWL